MRIYVNAAIGAVIGVAIGYEVYNFSRPNAAGLMEWLSSHSGLDAVDWIIWAIIGAAVAAELSLARN